MAHAASVNAQLTEPSRSDCQSEASLPDLLRVEDQVSRFGPQIENTQLLALSNGRKAVVFSIRNVAINGVFPTGKIIYTVTWNDACGRIFPDHSTATDGFYLNPNEYKTVESIAFNKNAVRAILRVHFE